MEHFFLAFLFLCGHLCISNGEPQRQDQGLWATLDGKPSLLMAHRGEKVMMPEHTVGSYEIASIEKADYVEPDLVLTKDNHLVCFHDLTIRSGTDVEDHADLAHLMTEFWSGELDGKITNITNDWFIANFTLAELRQLNVTQRVVGIRPQLFNQVFQIPTFQEYLDVIHKLSFKQNRSIGVIPELKHPKFHNQDREDNFMENAMLKVLRDNGYATRNEETSRCNYTSETGTVNPIPCPHILVQSFDFDALKYLKGVTNFDLLMLADTSYLRHLTYKGIEEIATVAKHFSVWKELMNTGVESAIAYEGIEYDKTEIENLGGFIPPKEFVTEAHKLGLKMGLFTIYDSHEKSYRGCAIECQPEDKEKELFYYFQMGVDGLFVENVQEAIELRMKFDHQLQMDNVKSSAPKIEIIKTFSYICLVFIAVNRLLRF